MSTGAIRDPAERRREALAKRGIKVAPPEQRKRGRPPREDKSAEETD